MPSIQNPLGALPARFRRQRLLIVGCGDVGLRVARALNVGPGARRMQVLALTSSPQRCDALRAAGVRPLLGNLDDRRSLRRLAGLGTRVLHLAPPEREPAPAEHALASANSDGRTLRLMQTLLLRSPPQALVYVSTSGVYGDCRGDWVAETRTVRPQTSRAQKRVAAEAAVRWLARNRWSASILRVPGIYAPDREGGTPRARLLRATPVLRAADDVHTNHIHAEDLARACLAALWRGKPQRVYNISDASELKMGDYFDLAADLYGLPRPPRIARAGAHEHLSPVQLSFMSESRRLRTERMAQELRVWLNYPTVMQGLRSAPSA